MWLNSLTSTYLATNPLRPGIITIFSLFPCKFAIFEEGLAKDKKNWRLILHLMGKGLMSMRIICCCSLKQISIAFIFNCLIVPSCKLI